jgi:hypothetical protein
MGPEQVVVPKLNIPNVGIFVLMRAIYPTGGLQYTVQTASFPNTGSKGQVNTGFDARSGHKRPVAMVGLP